MGKERGYGQAVPQLVVVYGGYFQLGSVAIAGTELTTSRVLVKRNCPPHETEGFCAGN